MFVKIVEAFWRDPGAKEEYASRYSVKPVWGGFVDGWCWENGAFHLNVALGTAHGRESLFQHLRDFRDERGPGVLVLGAHGTDAAKPRGQKRLQVTNAAGRRQHANWDDLTKELRGATAGLHDKALLIDSCSFCSNGAHVSRFMQETKVGLVAGFREAIEPLDGLVLELGFMNELLYQWSREAAPEFPADHLHAEGAEAETILRPAFTERYRGLIDALGFRVWTQAPGEKPRERTDILA